MDAGRWDEPITFETTTTGRYRTITSAAEAARALLEEWPADEGKALKAAKAACLSVMMGKKKPEAARKAFLKAAAEAEVFVRAN